MNTKHQSPAQVNSICDISADCSITEMQTNSEGNERTFSIVDSGEMELFPLMSPAGKDDVAMLYVEKGEVTLMLDMKTYKLSRGMLLYKVPKVTVLLLSYSEDCHFQVFCFTPQIAAGHIPIKHLETVTAIASNHPVFILDTLTAASVTVLFWLFKKKVNWEVKAQSPDETIQHIFSLLMLEMISSYKKKHNS